MFLLPVVMTAWLATRLPSPWLAVAAEALLRVAIVVGYVWAIGRAADVRRLFEYHAAEHMAITALEHGRDLTVPAIRREPREHPRCGTSFMLAVAVVAGLIFLPLGAPPLPWWLASRVALIPIVAAIAYEAIRFAAAQPQAPLVRWAFWGNLALQRLTTRAPDDEQIQIAVAALERARAEEGVVGTAPGSLDRGAIPARRWPAIWPHGRRVARTPPDWLSGLVDHSGSSAGDTGPSSTTGRGSPPAPASMKQERAPVWQTAPPRGSHLEHQRVGIAVGGDREHAHVVTGGGALVPDLLPATRPEDSLPDLERAAHRLSVHVAEHQHLTRRRVLEDRRNQSLPVVAQLVRVGHRGPPSPSRRDPRRLDALPRRDRQGSASA